MSFDRAGIWIRLVVKMGIAFFCLGFALLVCIQLASDGVAGIFHGLDTSIRRPLGGGDIIFILMVIGLLARVGFAALRGGRVTWREIQSPEPPQAQDGPPGSRWNSPEVELTAFPVSRPVEGDAPHAGEASVESENSQGGSGGGRELFWIGHAIVILCVVAGVISAFSAGGEAAPFGIGLGLALFFYGAGALVRMLE